MDVNCLFIVSKNNRSKLLRLILTVIPPLLLAKLIGALIPYPVMAVLMIAWVMLFGWFLIMRPNQYIDVYENSLLYKNTLTAKEKMISFAEIRDAYYSGFFLFRYLVLTDITGKPIVRLEADMENMDRFTAFLREKHIDVKESKERTQQL